MLVIEISRNSQEECNITKNSMHELLHGPIRYSEHSSYSSQARESNEWFIGARRRKGSLFLMQQLDATGISSDVGLESPLHASLALSRCAHALIYQRKLGHRLFPNSVTRTSRMLVHAFNSWLDGVIREITAGGRGEMYFVKSLIPKEIISASAIS